LDRFDHLADFLGCTGGPFSQCPHFIGNHRKATPLLTGTGGFNGSVKGQQIGLISNILNGTNKMAPI